MDSNTVKDILYNIFNFFCRNDITLNDIITYSNQFNLDNILLPTNLNSIYEEWDYNQKDSKAMKLISKKICSSCLC